MDKDNISYSAGCGRQVSMSSARQLSGFGNTAYLPEDLS